jgi:hypothetical protein
VALTITRIPDRYRPGFAVIRRLPLEATSAIAASLGSVSLAGGLKDITPVVKQAAGLSAEDADALVASLHSLYVFMASEESSSVEELVTTLMLAMRASGQASLAVPESEQADFVGKLTTLLTLSSLQRASKAEQLKSDHQSTFYDAKILTDLRPIFEEPSKRPFGAFISQTLKIVYHEGGKHKELYLSLDLNDTVTLKKIAERAIDKAASLKAFIKESNLSDIS